MAKIGERINVIAVKASENITCEDCFFKDTLCGYMWCCEDGYHTVWVEVKEDENEQEKEKIIVPENEMFFEKWKSIDINDEKLKKINKNFKVGDIIKTNEYTPLCIGIGKAKVFKTFEKNGEYAIIVITSNGRIFSAAQAWFDKIEDGI